MLTRTVSSKQKLSRAQYGDGKSGAFFSMYIVYLLMADPEQLLERQRGILDESRLLFTRN